MKAIEDRGGVGRCVAVAALLLWTAVPAGAQDVSEVPAPALLKPDVLLSVGRLVEGDLDPPVVVGSEAEGRVEDRSLTVFDRIYVPSVIDGRALAVEDRVRTFRIRRLVVDPVTGAPMGRVLVPTGVAVVDSLAGEVAVARIETAFVDVQVGDGVERVGEADTTAVPTRTVAGVTGYLIAFQGDEALHPPYEVMFLRLPAVNALGPGAAVEIHEPGEERDGLRLPDARIGRAMVVRVDGDVAAAILYDLRRSDAGPGDPFRSVELEASRRR